MRKYEMMNCVKKIEDKLKGICEIVELEDENPNSESVVSKKGVNDAKKKQKEILYLQWYDTVDLDRPSEVLVEEGDGRTEEVLAESMVHRESVDEEMGHSERDESRDEERREEVLIEGKINEEDKVVEKKVVGGGEVKAFDIDGSDDSAQGTDGQESEEERHRKGKQIVETTSSSSTPETDVDNEEGKIVYQHSSSSSSSSTDVKGCFSSRMAEILKKAVEQYAETRRQRWAYIYYDEEEEDTEHYDGLEGRDSGKDHPAYFDGLDGCLDIRNEEFGSSDETGSDGDDEYEYDDPSDLRNTDENEYEDHSHKLVVDDIVDECVEERDEYYKGGGYYQSESERSVDTEFEETDNEVEKDDDCFSVTVDPIFVNMCRREVPETPLQTEDARAGEPRPTNVMGYNINDNESEYEDSDGDLRSIPSNNEDEEPRYPTFNAETDLKNPKFYLKQVFPSFRVLKNAIRVYAVKERVGVEFKKNDKERVQAHCIPGCLWSLTARLFKKGPRCQIRKFYEEHNCVKRTKHYWVTYDWIALKYLEDIISDHTIPLSTLVDKIRRDTGLMVWRSKVARARKKALEMLRGDEETQYKKLGDYCGELKTRNPGSEMRIGLNELHLEKVFVCISGMKNGFHQCRPIISVDGCFMKGTYDCQLLSVVGIDSNDCIYPIAYAIVETESFDS